jgi:hypothetical protein
MSDAIPNYDGNITQISRITISSGAGATTHYIKLNPNKRTNILVSTGGETVAVSFSIDVRDSAGAFLGEPGASTHLYSEVFNATDATYFAGDNRGLSAVKIVTNPAAANVDYSITQITE